MVPQSLERKLSAILSADVVDYARLMAQDEAQTVRTIGDYREVIGLLVGQHRGRLVDFTGDNFLAEFPTATSAVECSLEIQRVIQARNVALPQPRRMHFRIGVHLGEVTVEEDRLYGDGVNIAARLEALAPAAGILVSGPVHEQVKRKVGISFEDLGERELKNIPDPVRTFGVRVDPSAEPGSAAVPRRRVGAVAYAVAAVGLLALAAGLAVSLRTPTSAEPSAVARFRLDVLGDGRLSDGSFPPIAISPNGHSIAYVADVGDTTQIFLRELASVEATPLQGSEGAFSPFFSPDGGWVAFFSNGSLRKLRTTGGDSVPICETSNFSFPSGSWGEDGYIRYSRGINVSGGMMQVPASGGEPTRLTTPDFEKGERWHGLPQQLPNGDLLFTVATAEGFRAALLSDGSEEWRILEELGPAVAARYQSSGRIVFGQPGRLLAAPWRPGEHTPGTPTSVLDDVHTSRLGIPYFALSRSGTLAYAQGGIVETVPVLLDRSGRATPLANDPGSFQHPRFAPDGKRLAVDVTWRGRTDIYVYELERGTRRRLTHTGFNIDPLWTLDGSGIVFRSTRRESEGQDLYRVPADGSGEAEILLDSEQDKVPGSWSPDGSLLIYTDISPSNSGMAVGLLDLSSGSTEQLLTGPYNVGWPVLSPDGTRIAYTSDESGQREVWVRPFRSAGAATQVSVGGGTEAVWSPEGDELFFRRGGSFFSVDMAGRDGAPVGTAREMFSGRFDLSPTGHQHFDIDSSGLRFAAIALGRTEEPRAVQLVLGWGSELDRLVPNP